MVTAPLSSVVQKKDLHVGGLGAAAGGAPASVTEPIPDLMDSLTRWARGAVREADDFLRSNPWTALAVVAAAGVAAGYLIAQQGRPSGILGRLRR